jgi:hypothetical protein
LEDGQQEGGSKKRIELSIRPELVNAGLGVDSVCPGLVSGILVSISRSLFCIVGLRFNFIFIIIIIIIIFFFLNPLPKLLYLSFSPPLSFQRKTTVTFSISVSTLHRHHHQTNHSPLSSTKRTPNPLSKNSTKVYHYQWVNQSQRLF